MNLFDQLVLTANKLEKRGLHKQSSAVDKITNNVLVQKTAQFVGVQGYWIKNTRCWQNCYRQKRAKNPKMPTQEVWNDCHKEYIEALKDDNSTWNKYASSDQTFDSPTAKKIIASAKRKFYKSMQKKINEGQPIGIAWMETTQDNFDNYSNKLISYANELVKIASTLDKEKDHQLISEILSASEKISKEAGLFGDLWGGLTGQGQEYQAALAMLTNQDIPALINILQRIKTNPSDIEALKKQFANYSQRLIRNLFAAKNNAGMGSRKIKNLFNQYTQLISQINTTIQGATDPNSIVQSVDQWINKLRQMIGTTEQAVAEDQQAKQERGQSQQERPQQEVFNKAELQAIRNPENMSSILTVLMQNPQVRKNIYDTLADVNIQSTVASNKNNIKIAAISPQAFRDLYVANPEAFSETFFSAIANDPSRLQQVQQFVQQNYSDEYQQFLESEGQQSQRGVGPKDDSQTIDQIEVGLDQVMDYLSEVRGQLDTLESVDKGQISRMKGGLTRIINILPEIDEILSRSEASAQQFAENYEPTDPYEQMGIARSSSKKKIREG
ncbi:MAG: hypothetical protein ACOC5T_03740 [Elusimicrobiota bacterium]